MQSRFSLTSVSDTFSLRLPDRLQSAIGHDLNRLARLVPMKKEWVLTQEAFDALLGWLDADREVAARKYETIRLRLVKIFVCRGCADAEDLADETINRVVAKLPEIAAAYVGEPAAYFYAVSQRIHQEYLRRIHHHASDHTPTHQMIHTTTLGHIDLSGMTTRQGASR